MMMMLEEEEGEEVGRNGCEDLSGLPEACIANILSLTTPRDVCRLSLLCSVFDSAARSDAVWNRFLPSDLAFLLPSSPSSSHLSKRHLFFRLCDSPILIDHHKKSLSLDRESGKKCYMLAPRGLSIVWADTPHYWTWIARPGHDSRFPEVVELVDVCWLEIVGKISTHMLSPNTNYAGFLVFKWTEHPRGFSSAPVKVSVGVDGGKESHARYVHFRLDSARSQPRRHTNRTTDETALPWHERPDGWCEIELGEFFNRGNNEDEEILNMSFKEVEGGNWKSGLIVGGIEVRPKVRGN